MVFDATFWVAVSFVIFFGALVYFKVPQNVNNLLSKMIGDISSEPRFGRKCLILFKIGSVSR